MVNLQSAEGVNEALERSGISIIDSQNQQKVEDGERLVKELKHLKTYVSLDCANSSCRKQVAPIAVVSCVDIV